MDREQNIRAIIDAHFAGFSEEIRDSAVACIMTLKEQPCEDSISRKAAISAMREETCGCCWDAKDILAHLPSVSTEKTGRWINARVGKLFPSRDFKCSECGNILDFYGVNCGRGDANYCPNCGCRMMGVEE